MNHDKKTENGKVVFKIRDKITGQDRSRLFLSLGSIRSHVTSEINKPLKYNWDHRNSCDVYKDCEIVKYTLTEVDTEEIWSDERKKTLILKTLENEIR